MDYEPSKKTQTYFTIDVSASTMRWISMHFKYVDPEDDEEEWEDDDWEEDDDDDDDW
jgi:hypothetical protein